MIKHKNKVLGPKRSAGFTVVELVTVISIFAVVASVVLFKFGDFNSKITLDNLAQDIGLRIISAQKAAISGVVNISSIGGVKPTYGMYFKAGPAATADTTQFVYFTDIPTKNGLFDATPSFSNITCPTIPTSSNECLSVTQITTGEFISNICYTPAGGGTVQCTNEAHITFTRPFPDATILVRSAPGSPALAADKVVITLSNVKNPPDTRTITVTNLGEVIVSN